MWQMICDLAKRAEANAVARSFEDHPPGFIPPDDIVYSLHPLEREPEISIRADLLAESRDWGHANLGIEGLYNSGFRGAGVLVAICDTGVDYTHPDLAARVNRNLCKDFTGSGSGYMDKQGHGTHCSGIVAASADGAGMVGVAPEATLMLCKVLGDTGSGASSWIANGIRHAVDSGADIISLSLGGPSPDAATRAAIQYAVQNGAWVVCAAGNDGGPAEGYPGDYPESVAVCATDRNNKRATFSTINRENDISAPGVNIMSTLPGGRYGSMSGTSMATPYVAGCLALVRGAIKRAGGPMPTQGELLSKWFKQTATDLEIAGKDDYTGWGLVQPKAMILAMIAPEPPDPPDPPTPPGKWIVKVPVELTLSGDGTKPTKVSVEINL